MLGAQTRAPNIALAERLSTPIRTVGMHPMLFNKSNRSLTSYLIEEGLMDIAELGEINEIVFKHANEESQEGKRKGSVLHIIVNDKKLMKEEALIQHVLEKCNIPPADLTDIEMADEVKMKIDEDWWNTWTIIFDIEEGFYFLASPYCGAPFVRQHWQTKLGKKIVWHTCTLEAISQLLEEVQSFKQAKESATV